jgi:hypothetical protein
MRKMEEEEEEKEDILHVFIATGWGCRIETNGGSDAEVYSDNNGAGGMDI